MSLTGKVCLVTGASRGIGRGIALALGSEGATVYITGRTLDPVSTAPGSLTVTADEINARGGKAITVKCDHGIDTEVYALFDRIRKDEGHLDLLVNNAFQGSTYIGEYATAPFWETPLGCWDQMIRVGLRSHYVAAIEAAKIMVPQSSGLIVNISSSGALYNFFNIPYGVGKAGVDKMAEMAGPQLEKHNVTFISLWPGLTRTEYALSIRNLIEKDGIIGKKLDYSKAESVEYSGRAIAALLKDPNVHKKTGKTMTTADLGDEYGLADVDGRRHESTRSLKSWFAAKLPFLSFCIPSFVKLPWFWISGSNHHYY